MADTPLFPPAANALECEHLAAIAELDRRYHRARAAAQTSRTYSRGPGGERYLTHTLEQVRDQVDRMIGAAG